MQQKLELAATAIGWSAVEAAMREATMRDQVEIDRPTPRMLLKSLYADGVISREDYEHASECLHLRNQIIHGFPPKAPLSDALAFLMDFATRLLRDDAGEPALPK